MSVAHGRPCIRGYQSLFKLDFRVFFALWIAFFYEKVETFCHSQILRIRCNLEIFEFDMIRNHVKILQMWQVADESPSSELMFNATGALPVPEAPFLFMYIEQNRHGPFNVLQSDPIDCQTENTAKFNFRLLFLILDSLIQMDFFCKQYSIYEAKINSEEIERLNCCLPSGTTLDPYRSIHLLLVISNFLLMNEV